MEYQVYDKFEYKIETVSNHLGTFERQLNQFGQEGWELIDYNANNRKIILKRKLECTNIINE